MVFCSSQGETKKCCYGACGIHVVWDTGWTNHRSTVSSSPWRSQISSYAKLCVSTETGESFGLIPKLAGEKTKLFWRACSTRPGSQKSIGLCSQGKGKGMFQLVLSANWVVSQGRQVHIFHLVSVKDLLLMGTLQNMAHPYVTVSQKVKGPFGSRVCQEIAKHKAELDRFLARVAQHPKLRHSLAGLFNFDTHSLCHKYLNSPARHFEPNFWPRLFHPCSASSTQLLWVEFCTQHARPQQG